MDVYEALMEAREKRRPYALATIVKTEGVTPRGVGSKMLVYKDGSFMGSIGGGILEKQVLGDAVQCIADCGKLLYEYENRDEETDSPCGGTITVYIEAEEGAPDLVVVGAGHVGAGVIRLASALGYYVTVIDIRDTEMTMENTRDADIFVLAEDFAEGVEALPMRNDAFYLVSTFSHGTDCDALAAVLEKGAKHIAMMGSSAKIKTIFAKLRERGFSEAQLAAVNTPAGLDIGGETAEEVAFAIVAEMQMQRYGGTGRPLRDGR